MKNDENELKIVLIERSIEVIHPIPRILQGNGDFRSS
jgi:hypothetical protein